MSPKTYKINRNPSTSSSKITYPKSCGPSRTAPTSNSKLTSILTVPLSSCLICNRNSIPTGRTGTTTMRTPSNKLPIKKRTSHTSASSIDSSTPIPSNAQLTRPQVGLVRRRSAIAPGMLRRGYPSESGKAANPKKHAPRT